MKRFLFLLLMIALSGCATNSDFDLLRQDLSNLRRESSEAKKEIDSLREKNLAAARDLDTLREKTAGIVKEDAFLAVRENQAELTSRLSDVANSLQDLRGRFEENKYNLEKTFRDSAIERDLLKAQITALENQVKALRDKMPPAEEANRIREQKKPGEETKTEPEKNSGSDDEGVHTNQATEEPLRDGNSGKKAYDSAYQAFKDRKYRESKEKFEAYVKDYPKSKLTDNAQFWIAESLYAEKDYEGAILAYESLLKKYPDSKKATGSLLKQGFAFIEMGDAKTGKTILKKLVEKHPESKEAAVAKKKIAEIEKKPSRKK